MPHSVPAVVVVGLVVAGSTLIAARATRAQPFETAFGGTVAEAALRAVQDARAVRGFDLTLADAVERALERNRQIAVQRISPFVRDMQVATANAAFLPLASSGFGLNRSTLPSRSLLDGGGLRGASIVTDQGSYDVGVGQRVRWGGGRYDVTWNSSRLESTNTFTNFNPSLAATASLTYTQPLLRGFRTDNERTQLVVSRIDRDISDIDLDETIVNTLADVRLAYWELVHAHAAVEVQRQSLALAEQLVRDNRARVEIGMVGEIEVVQARASSAAAAVVGRGGSPAANQRAGPQAAHRRRQDGRAVECRDQPDGTSRGRKRFPSISTRRSGLRSTGAPTSTACGARSISTMPGSRTCGTARCPRSI